MSVEGFMQQSFQFDYELYSSWEKLADADLQLAALAFEAMDLAYAPYSEFKVGAAIRLSNGLTLKGNNQENIAYPSGLCAERVVLFYAGANYPKEAIDTICVVAKGELMPSEFLLSPCGSCRQVMLETENRQAKKIRVILVNQDKRTIVLHSVKDLLPFGFGK
ncbi:MAG: cytidine deaminase [Flavobacteriales bacterium]